MIKFSFDTGELGKSTITNEGFLRAPVKMSRVGVMDYGHAKKVKTPENLFSTDTIDSFRGMPITNEHPQEDGSYVYVDGSNYSKYAKGTISEPERDGKFLKGVATVWDPDLIKEIQSGDKVEVSMGYGRDDEYTPGEFDGESYDAVQKNITGNHLAFTTKGRAGEMVKIEIDSADIKNYKTGNKMPNIKYVKIDADDNNKIISDRKTFTYNTSEGDDIQVDSDIKDEFTALKKVTTDSDHKNKELEDKVKKLEKTKTPEGDSEELKTSKLELDTEKAITKKLQLQIDNHKSEFDSAVDTSVNDRIDLLKNAKALNIETDKKSNQEIKKEIISSHLDVDGNTLKTDVEVDAYYKAALKIVRKDAIDPDDDQISTDSNDLMKQRQIEIDKLNNPDKK